MATNIEAVQELFAQGASSQEAMKMALTLEVPAIVLIKMFREQYGLSLVEAKELMVNVETGKSLSQYQHDLFFGDETSEEVENRLRED